MWSSLDPMFAGARIGLLGAGLVSALAVGVSLLRRRRG
jgi:hypothetical protein